jgi:hypothetical protein
LGSASFFSFCSLVFFTAISQPRFALIYLHGAKIHRRFAAPRPIQFLQHQNVKTEYMKTKRLYDSPYNQRILDRNGKSMSDMQATGDIGKRESHNEAAFWFQFYVGGHLGQENQVEVTHLSWGTIEELGGGD